MKQTEKANTAISKRPEEPVFQDDRPYEKCMAQGASVLTDAELLAVILRTGVSGKPATELAKEILGLCRYEQGISGILHLSFPQLMDIRGVGTAKAAQILCICELSKRIAKSSAKQTLSFRDPESISAYYMESLRHEEQEMVICMFLDTKNHLLAEKMLTKGTVNQSLISPRELFLEALSYHAVQLILIHNHPSGDPTPSSADIAVTHKIFHAGELLGITLTDHIVIGEKSYVSFLEEGLLDGI